MAILDVNACCWMQQRDGSCLLNQSVSRLFLGELRPLVSGAHWFLLFCCCGVGFLPSFDLLELLTPVSSQMWSLLSNVFCGAGFVDRCCLNLVLLWNIFLFPSIVFDNFARYSDLGGICGLLEFVEHPSRPF